MNTKWMVRSIFTTVISLLAAFLLLFLFNVIAYGSEDPDRYVAVLGKLAVFFGALLCGILSLVLNRGRGRPAAAFSGICYVVLILILSLFFLEESSFSFKSIMWYAGMWLCSFLPGLFFGEKKTKTALKPYVRKKKKRA